MSLFGSMFEEEGGDRGGFSVSRASGGCSGGADGGTGGGGYVPVGPRLPCKLCGIYNQGATCYLNSLLQTLLMTREFREALFQLGPSELGKLADKDKKNAKVRVIPIQLQRMFARLLLLDAQGASTTDLTDSFGWSNNEGMVQHDVQELNRILFCAIDDSLVGTQGQSLIKNYYHGSIVNQISCQECGRVSEREEDFLDLCVTVAGLPDLPAALQAAYIETELLDGKNCYRCDACDKLVVAKKGACLRHLPPILTISLLRFSFDYKKMERYKETGKFVFPTDLDMSPYCENLTMAGNTDYELFSIVIHRGSTHGGHYHAYIRDIDCLGKWTHPEEESIQLPMDPATGKVDMLELDSPVELVTALITRGPAEGMSINKICEEMTKQTGVSWNKRFKNKHGTFVKFLKKNDDRFTYTDDTQNIQLKTSSSQKSPTTPSSHPSGEPHPSKEPSKEFSAPVDPQPLIIEDRRPKRSPRQESKSTESPGKIKDRPQTPPPDPGQSWFDFDDSRVRPIKTSAIEKQFSGKESAYMLFYRQKGMSAYQKGKGDPSYSVPEDLISRISVENEKLKSDRLEYELKMNTVTLEIHLGHTYSYHNGALHTAPEAFHFLTFPFDRRRNIAQLRDVILETCCGMITPDFVLHTARERPAGLHLYDAITDINMTVMASPIGEGSKLFVWDGVQIGGYDIPVGSACEPVLLNVTYGNSTTIQNGYPKCLTVGELKAILEDLSLQEADTMQLSRIITKGDESVLLKVLAADDGKTLKELGVCDGDQFIIDNSESEGTLAAQLVESQSKLVSFVVEIRFQETDSVYPLITVEVNREVTVEEVRATVLSKLSCDVAGQCRLRVDDDSVGIKAPLHEQQTVSAAGLQQGQRLVLEHGAPPNNNQLMLRFSVGKTITDAPHQEITLGRSNTVQQCLVAITAQAPLSGDNWHLRRTNWCGEAGDILDDLDATLDQCHILHGHHLLVQEGRLPPKGYMRLALWLYPSPEPVPMETRSGLIGWVYSSIQGWMGGSTDQTPAQSPATASTNAVFLGDVIISKQSTLSELKEQALGLPGLATISLPMASFLRVRFSNHSRPGTILRGDTVSLQRLKVTGSVPIVLQILQQEEELSASEILLHIQMRVHGTLGYSPPHELRWDTTRGAGPFTLRQAVADHFSIPVEHLVIAKHFPDKYEWTVVKESSPQHQKGQKSKKKGGGGGGGAKMNLRHAPFSLTDGDTIGVKDLREDAKREDHMLTEADVDGQAQMKAEAEEKRKRREEQKKLNASMDPLGQNQSKKNRAEVGIKIHVGDFA